MPDGNQLPPWLLFAAREVPLFNSTDAIRPAAARAGIALHPHFLWALKKAGKFVVMGVSNSKK